MMLTICMSLASVKALERFVGANAEGAITFYSFDSGSIDPVTGVGFFDRTGVNTPPP